MSWVKNIVFIALLNFVTIVIIVTTASLIQSPKSMSAPESIPTATPAGIPNIDQEAQSKNGSFGQPPQPSFFPANTNIPIVITESPSSQPSVSQTPTTAPQSERCIITLDGSKYDITIFQNIHSGGNVFTCGSDQSQLFHDQHPDSFLDKLAKYKI